MTPTLPREAPRFPRALLLLVVLVAILVRGAAADGGFLNYDDGEIRAEAQTKGVLDVWTGGFYYAYKPVYGTSIVVDERLFGDDPLGWHVVNVVLFALGCGLAALVACAVARSVVAGLAVGVLLAVHPVHAENVAWVAERKDVLSLALVLLGHLAWRAKWRASTAPSIVGLVLLVLGGLAKGTVWTYAGVVAIDEALSGPAAGRARRMLALALVALAGIGLDVGAGYSMGPGGVRHDATPLELAAAMAGVHARYALSLLWPVRLSIDHPVDPRGSLADPFAIAGLLLAVAAVAGLFVGVAKKKPVLALGCGLWVLGLLPVNNVWPTTSVLRADRYLLVPAIGLYLAVGAWLAGRKAVGVAALGVAAVVLAVLAVARGEAFASPETVWTDAMQAEPASALAPLARAQARQSSHAWKAVEADAKAGIDRALALRRPELVVRGRLLRSLALLATGDVAGSLDEANDAVRDATALARSPYVREPQGVVADAHVRVAQAFVASARAAEDPDAAAQDVRLAADEFRKATSADPRSFEAWLGLGSLLGARGGPAAAGEATDALAKAWALRPGEPQVAVPYVTMLYKQRRDAEAERVLHAAEARGGTRDLMLLRAQLKEQADDDAEAAAKILESVLAGRPRDDDVRDRLSSLRLRQAQAALVSARRSGERAALEKAIVHADQALAVDDRLAEAQTSAGDALFAMGRYREARDRYRKARALEPAAAWRASLEARAAAYEALAALGRKDDDGAALAMAAIVAASPPRLDLGFQPLDYEIVRLGPAKEALEAGTMEDAPRAAAVLRAAVRLVGGDDAGAERDAVSALGSRAAPPERGSKAEAVVDMAALLRAIARARRLDFAGARADLARLLAAHPGDPLFRHHALLVDRQEAVARARIVAAEAGDDPAHPDERLRARQEEAAAKVADVVARIRAAADADAPWPGPGLLAVEMDMSEQSWLAAAKRLAALRAKFPLSPAVRRGEASVYEAQALMGGDRGRLLGQAQRALGEAKALDPRDPRTALELSQLHRISGNLDAALSYAMQASSAEPVAGPASQVVAAILVERGRKALAAKDVARALTAIESARTADPASAAPEILAGDVRMAEGSYDAALAAYRLAREKEPSSKAAIEALAECHRRRGAAYFVWRLKNPRPREPAELAEWQAKDTAARRQAADDLAASLRLEPEGARADEARRNLDSIERLDPETRRRRMQEAEAAYAAGESLRREGNWASALLSYREATSQFPDYLPAWMRTAEASVALGAAHDEEGLRAVEVVRDLDPTGHWPEPDLYAGEIWVRRFRAGKAEAAERARLALGRFVLRATGRPNAQASLERAKSLLEKLPEK